MSCRCLRLSCLAVILLSAGCTNERIETTYGRRRGSDGAGRSVNGTAVLANMFRNAGYRVSTWRRLSPKLDSADTILWFPDDYAPPEPEQRQFLERWLRQGSRRTLVYVGRDYDAAIRYWENVLSSAPPEQALEVARRLAEAQSKQATARTAMPAEQDSYWFTVQRESVGPEPRDWGGPWSAGIDADAAEVEIASRLEPTNQVAAEPLLTIGDVPFVFELSDASWGDSKMLVVANGSFLLNVPLVNYEHRKLAGRLIAACEPAERVVFLESGNGGPAIVERDADSNFPTGLELFTVWPLGFVMLHLAILGITLCIAVFPIFGRPRELATGTTSDFSQHVTALGELLARTHDRAYAIEKLRYYKEQVRKE